MSKDIPFTKLIGKSIFFAGLQAAFGSVLMSSTFSVLNFSKDQQTLQGAADALRHYLFVALMWTTATMLVMYGSFGMCGLWIGLAANIVIGGWIVGIYLKAFKEAANRYNLKYPNILWN